MPKVGRGPLRLGDTAALSEGPTSMRPTSQACQSKHLLWGRLCNRAFLGGCSLHMERLFKTYRVLARQKIISLGVCRREIGQQPQFWHRECQSAAGICTWGSSTSWRPPLQRKTRRPPCGHMAGTPHQTSSPCRPHTASPHRPLRQGPARCRSHVCMPRFSLMPLHPCKGLACQQRDDGALQNWSSSQPWKCVHEHCQACPAARICPKLLRTAASSSWLRPVFSSAAHAEQAPVQKQCCAHFEQSPQRRHYKALWLPFHSNPITGRKALRAHAMRVH